MTEDEIDEAVNAEVVRVQSMVGLRVGIARKQQRLSMQKLAEKSGYFLVGLIKIEQGTANPRLENLVRIAAALNLSVDDLVRKASDEELALERGVSEQLGSRVAPTRAERQEQRAAQDRLQEENRRAIEALQAELDGVTRKLNKRGAQPSAQDIEKISKLSEKVAKVAAAINPKRPNRKRATES